MFPGSKAYFCGRFFDLLRMTITHITMKKILVFVLMLSALMAGAQEKALYRVTYDCDAQYGPQSKVYRWHLDIGETSAVFYSPNNRAKDKVIDEVVGDNDVTSVMARLRTIRSEFPNPNPLEVLVEPSAEGRYTYLNDIVSDKMWYEEKLPEMSWETTGRDTTVCGYACLQAKAMVYGRDWTVWFAPEIPVSYGPYVLGGLPGLILGAEDADGLFHFTAIGLEQNPVDAVVELARKDKAVKCTRKKYMELREKANGQSYADKLREMGVDSRTVVKVVSEDGKVGVLVEINCETDFAAGNEQFRALVEKVAKHIAATNPADLAALNASEIDGKTVEALVTEATATIGEKISLRRFTRFESAGKLASYIHMGGKIGVLVNLTGGSDELGKDVAMQVAAANPISIDESGVPADVVEHEKEVARKQAEEEGKPAKIIDRIVEGRIKKYYKEVCLDQQIFVKDSEKTISDILGGEKVTEFVRYQLGEGIEKKQEDFAAEVKAQMQ